MDIKFEFAETISPNKDYKFYKNYLSGGTELAFIIEESPNKLVIQHLLVVMDTMIIKHQDFKYMIKIKDGQRKYLPKKSRKENGKLKPKIWNKNLLGIY